MSNLIKSLKKIADTFGFQWFFITLFLILFVQLNHFNDLPGGVHQWAQADRYAIAARFLEDRPFSHPATFSLSSEDGEVGVEFPWIQYSLAKFCRLTGLQSHLPAAYRLMNLLILCTGLLVFVRSFPGWGFIQNTAFCLISISSPILLNYGCGFLPDSSALGLVLMGLGWYRRGSGIFIFLSLLILTLAALTKTTAGVYLLSILALLIYHHLFKKRNFKMVLLYLLSGLFLLSLIAWYDYQYVYQRNIELWSTLFLSETQMPESAAVVQRIFESIWLFLPEYMNVVQWSILLMGIALMFGIKFLSKHWLLISLFSTGALAIFLLFGKQFIYHDYYVIAPYLPIAIGIQMLTVKQAGLFMRRTALSLLLLVLAVISFSLGSSRAFARMSERTTLKGSAQLNETTWLENAGNWFSDHTKQSSKVFVVYEMEPNLALVYLNRTGIVFNEEEMGRDTSNFYYWLERRKPEYILCRRQNQIEFYKEHADFYQSCNLSFESEEFIILKPHGY